MNPIFIWLSGFITVGAILEYKNKEYLLASCYMVSSITTFIAGLLA